MTIYKYKTNPFALEDTFYYSSSKFPIYVINIYKEDVATYETIKVNELPNSLEY